MILLTKSGKLLREDMSGMNHFKRLFIFAIFKEKMCEICYRKKCSHPKSCFIIANMSLQHTINL